MNADGEAVLGRVGDQGAEEIRGEVRQRYDEADNGNDDDNGNDVDDGGGNDDDGSDDDGDVSRPTKIE